MGVARQQGTGGSAAAPGHLEAIHGVAHHKAFKGVSGLAPLKRFIKASLPLIEREEDAEYG